VDRTEELFGPFREAVSLVLHEQGFWVYRRRPTHARAD